MLKLGDLVAYIKVDKSGLDRGLAEGKAEFKAAGDDMDRNSAASAASVAMNWARQLGAWVTASHSSHQRVAADIDTTTEKIRTLAQEYAKTGDKSLLGDMSKAESDLKRLQAVASQLGSGGFESARQAVTNFGTGLTNVTTNVWNLIPVLLGVAAAANFAIPSIYLLGGALGSLPALAVGAGAALGVLGLGFMGISDAFKKTASAGGAAVDTAHQVAMAERNLSDAQIGALQAQENLNRARETAKKTIDDLNRSLADQRLSEEEAALAEKDALAALAQAHRTGTRDQIEHADLAYRRAVQNADDVKAKTAETEQQQRKATAAGVEGSDQVRQAIDAQRKSTEQVADAQYALTQAHKQQATAAAGAAAETTKLAASARELVDVIKSLKDPFDSLRLDVQQRLFAGVGGEIRDLARAWLPELHHRLGDMADTFNGIFKRFADSAKNPEFVANIGAGIDSVRAMIDRIGESIAGPFMDAFGRLSRAAGPFVRQLGDEIGHIVDDFSNWIKQADQSGGLTSFFDKASKMLHDVFDIGRDVFSIIGSIFSILAGGPAEKAGTSVFEQFKKGMDSVAAWFRDPKNQQMVRDWFQKIEDAVKWFVTEGIPTIESWVKKIDSWITRADAWGNRIIQFKNDVVGAFDSVIGFFTSLPGRIGKATSGMWDGIKDSFRSAINWIIGAWNRLSFSLPSVDTHIPGVGRVGGFTLDTPNIPYLADGGVVRATPGGRLAVMGEGGQDEAVIPLNKLDGMMRGQQVTVKFNADDSSVMAMLLRNIRYTVKADYSGDVTQAFAGG